MTERPRASEKVEDAAAGLALASGAALNALAFFSSNLRAIFTFLVARLLGSPVLGTFGVAWATADLASKFGTLGLDYSVMAFVARSEGDGDREGSRRIMRVARSHEPAQGNRVGWTHLRHPAKRSRIPQASPRRSRRWRGSASRPRNSR